MDQKSVKIEVWRRLGASCGVFGCLEGVPLGILGRLGSLCGRLGRKRVAKMAPSWLQKKAKSVLRRPGAVLGASWRLHVVDFHSKVNEIEACYVGFHFWMDF